MIFNKSQFIVRNMNSSYKLKIRPLGTGRQDSSIRRIRTDHLDTLKKLGKQPLADNKKILNINEKVIGTKPNKKVTAIKSTIGKSAINYSRLTTQPSERPQYLQHHRTATAGEKPNNIEKPNSSNHQRKSTINGSFKKKQTKQPITVSVKPVRQSQGKEPKEVKGGEDRYELEKKVGSGTFGTVHKARDKRTLEIVAIKKVYQDKNYKNRELQILKILNHPNVLSMKDSYFTYDHQKKQYLNVVMDYYQHNLYEAIKKNKNSMPRLKFKIYAYQLFRSLLYLNYVGIAHRDIKPQNVLVNEETLKLVMCDFGSAKQLKVGEPNIAYICSRCYRAPQLIFGNTAYTTQIDMWSTGCVLAEMFIGYPLFQGDSNIDQLVEIIKILGCPSNQQILEMNPNHDLNKFQLPKIPGKTLNKVFVNYAATLGDQFINLMKNVLCYSPSKRFTPFQALCHPFFDELRNQSVYKKMQAQFGFDSLFDYDRTCEAKVTELRKLTPEWY